ncbi:Pr6Pr family membrane protein [Frondihabitans cladoniiphilus]|uniref:Pr6Pr family membrane protein n=1 Tax=Frondihabitans cladoniiphilus TaxID=715785 RepID=UPI0031EEE968
MRIAFAGLRLVAATAIVVAVVAQWSRSLESPDYAFANFFGYFTIQSNLLLAVAFVLVAAFGLRRLVQPGWLVAFRGATTTYIATTGVVYNLLLAGAPASDFTVAWSNDIVHKWIPLYAVLDWILTGDRTRILGKRLWFFLIYPIAWLVVVLLRGQSFVPYPFLDVVKLGAGTVALYCVAIAVFIALMSAVVIALSRYRLLRPVDDPTYERAIVSST